MSNNYDAVVIGSGIGGLTCGAFLAKKGAKVLVLEQHFQIGGYTHSFKRRGFRFESAVHSVPMGKNGLVFHLLNELGVGDSLNPLPLTSMYRSMWPDFSYSLPPLYDDIINSLCSNFPHESENLHRVFDSMRSFYDSFITPIKEGSLAETELYQSFINNQMNRSYKEYLDSFITDSNLRSIFYSQWPFGGTPPAFAPVAYYVLMFIVHAMEGSHYLEGGFSKLADTLASVITDTGGSVLMKKRVTKIEVENGRATRVLTSDGDEFRAPLFISNISPASLHRDIIDEKARNKMWLRRLKNLNSSVSSMILYLGLSDPLEDIFEDNINFWYAHRNDDLIFSNTSEKNLTEPDHLIFLKTPHKKEKPTLTMMNFIRQSCSEEWKTDKHLHARRMLDKASEIFPGLQDRIMFTEIGSPDTFQRYTSNAHGALYGFENTKSIYGEAKLPSKTHLKNLYQTGHWGKPGGGIWNAMYNGYVASLAIGKESF